MNGGFRNASVQFAAHPSKQVAHINRPLRYLMLCVADGQNRFEHLFTINLQTAEALVQL
jgi:hypothetical protein